MPIQIFEITRVPEEPPLKPESVRKLLWYAFPMSEWEVREIISDEPGKTEVKKLK